MAICSCRIAERLGSAGARASSTWRRPPPAADAELAPLGLALQRHLRAGAVHAHLLRPVAKSHQI